MAQQHPTDRNLMQAENCAEPASTAGAPGDINSDGLADLFVGV